MEAVEFRLQLALYVFNSNLTNPIQLILKDNESPGIGLLQFPDCDSIYIKALNMPMTRDADART